MSTENREVAYLKDKPLSEDYAYVYGELEDGSIVKISKEQLGIEQLKEDVTELNSKIAYQDFSFRDISFAAYTIGTRGNQYSVDVSSIIKNGYVVMNTEIIYVSESANMIPVCFYSESDIASAKIYLNIYRATSSAVSGQQVNVRVFFYKP